MDLETYRELIDEFYTTSGIDAPPQAAIDSWHEHLRGYSITVLYGALNRLKLTLERKPYNMLQTIKEAAQVYVKEHPEARTAPDYGDCDECNGEGIFFVKFAANGEKEKKQSAIIVCGSCENWCKLYGSLEGKLRLKKFEAQYQGFEIQE